jgi:hypothetical protein
MKQKETLKNKALRLWQTAKLPKFFNKYGPKKTPGWQVFLCYLEYVAHAPAWRRAANFMMDYHHKKRHWTSWQKAIAKWPSWVWTALRKASAGDKDCLLAALDGTTLARSNPSEHYLRRIDDKRLSRPVQQVVLVDVLRRKFLNWRVRSRPRGEKCDVLSLIKGSPFVETLVLDKNFDAEYLHVALRALGTWSVAPVRKGCRRGMCRKQLRDYFDYGLYWQRSIIESMFSAVKRLFGVHLRARCWRAQRAEVFARLIAYNIGAKTALLSTEPFKVLDILVP